MNSVCSLDRPYVWNDAIVELEFTEHFDEDELLDRFEMWDTSLTMGEIEYLRRNGVITTEERNRYFDVVLAQSSDESCDVDNGGFASTDEAGEMLDDVDDVDDR